MRVESSSLPTYSTASNTHLLFFFMLANRVYTIISRSLDSFLISTLACRRMVRYQVSHSYGGAVFTNAAHNNPNVTGLVYIGAFTETMSLMVNGLPLIIGQDERENVLNSNNWCIFYIE